MSDSHELQELALRLSAFADVLNQHATRLVEEADSSTQTLRETASAFSIQAQQLSRDLVNTVGMQAREVIERHAADGMQESSKALHRAATHAESVATAMQGELQRLGAAQNSLVWKSGLGLLAGALLAVCGSGYLVWKNQQALKRSKFSSDMVEAMRIGALTRCGDTLCARVGAEPKRFGDKGEYVQIE